MRRNFTPDQTLVDRLLLHDTDAFEELYRRHWFALYSYSFSKLKSPDDSKMIVRNVFCSLWQQREHLPVNFSLASWLYAEVRKAVLECVNSKIESMAEDFFIERQIIPGFTPKELYKARKPVSTSDVIEKARRTEILTPVIVNTGSKESWWEKYYHLANIKGLKNMVQTMMNF